MPLNSENVLDTPAPRLDPDSIRRLLDDGWGLQAAVLRPLPSERDLNVLVGEEYVLKVSNPAERAAVVDMENAAMEHVRRVAPDLPVPRVAGSVATVADEAGLSCLARLITVVPGSALEGTPITVDLAEQVGALAARTSLALQGLFHPAAERELDWDVRRAPAVLAAPGVLDGLGAQGRLLRPYLDRLTAAAGATRGLPSGQQHADVTLTNVLAHAGTVTGLIDFGDMHHTAAVCDLAVTLTSVLRNTADEQPHDLWELTAATLLGYQRHRLLTPAEVDVLGDLVVARLALTLAIAARRAPAQAGNAAYIGQYDGRTRSVLGEWCAGGPAVLTDRLHRMAGTRSGTAAAPGLLERRHAAMGGPLAPLFYSTPLEIVRGSGPWLYAADGTRYLDAYNNVAVVGHAHPAVTQAVSRQLAELNTHSRYLHPRIVELAERLLATMPAGLDTCLFTTSGTEANDLAWRMATAHTGGHAAIIAEHAYHGSSKWMADLSSNEWPDGYRPAHVGTFAAPRGEVDRATAVARIAAAAGQLDRPALVLADIGFTSEGVLDAPAAFLAGLVDGAHQAGALFLADEVQSGFGRSGPAMWRFAAAGITPDLVTLGKPMGAGYPIGALITRREIADSLARDYEYFSTFAATPAAAAASCAVLDVLETGRIPERAALVGEHLRGRLRALAAGSASIGAVRGFGLIAGVDLPDRRIAVSVLDGLVSRGVLAGLTGPGGTVLKIRPPLIWREEHADRFVDALAASLR
ncbi:aminotransferase class III-fold pyridoxal phosphate-dependent enzyme [Actinoplanes sp. NPDC051633]|uniref:aminotransferase class III-fold pyridoxal phosphate-dependent enzyme n=1 Tax=Actinoplanes sp. NPDC051633 TaxID=3155670 RepID=UPI003438D433